MTKEQLDILTNIIGAVESGGQIYGNRRYDAYAGPYTNSDKEFTVTLGWAQNYGGEARRLCKMIFDKDPVAFRKVDTANIEDKLNVDWVATRWNPTFAQKKALIAIITTDVGKECQDELFQELMLEYIEDAEQFGVTSVQAQMMWCEIEHLGGLGPTKRIFTRASKPYTPDSIFASLVKDQNDTSNSNQVGDKKFQSRHECCVKWIKEYVTDGSSTTSSRNWLQKGDSGSEVKEMQELLIANGFDCGSSGADGEFGDDTEKAVKAFQAKYGLTVDGQYGEKSKAKLKGLSNNTDSNTGGESMGSIYNIIEKERYYASIPYTEVGSTNHQKFSDIVDNAGLMGCQDQAWCATYQFALELEEFGKAQALKNWNMTSSNYCGYNVFSTEAKFPSSKKGKTPKIGALVIFKQSHMGRVLSINSSAKTFECGEGNTSNAQYDRNGNACAVKTYSWYDSKIKSFCYIDYDGVSTSTPSSSTSSSLNESPKWNGTVTTTLNVRTWAGSENATVSFSPLKSGTSVGICDTIQAKDGSDWYYIEYNGKHGFASAKYITKGTPSNISASDHKAWLKRLQKAIGAKVDGEPGPETLSKCPVLQDGSSGTVVKLVQEYLGNYCRIGVTGGYDGKFGQGTDAAVMEFQKQNDLTIDAIVGQDTWKAILWM